MLLKRNTTQSLALVHPAKMPHPCIYSGSLEDLAVTSWKGQCRLKWHKIVIFPEKKTCEASVLFVPLRKQLRVTCQASLLCMRVVCPVREVLCERWLLKRQPAPVCGM